MRRHNSRQGTVPCLTSVTEGRYCHTSKTRNRPLSHLALSCLLVALLLLGVPATAYAEVNLSIADLVKTAELHDNQQVRIDGEAIGDSPNEENGMRWLTLQDGDASISVCVTIEDAEKVVHLGRYDQVGTRLEVTGIFQVDCVTHNGLTDIHAQSVKVIDPGHDVASELSLQKVAVGAVLIALGLVLLVVFWRLRERTR